MLLVSAARSRSKNFPVFSDLVSSYCAEQHEKLAIVILQIAFAKNIYELDNRLNKTLLTSSTSKLLISTSGNPMLCTGNLRAQRYEGSAGLLLIMQCNCSW